MLAATILSSLIAILTILIHFEVINALHHWKGEMRGGIRVKIISGVFLLFAAHSVEIWLFAGGIYLAKNVFMLGGLTGMFSETSRDYLYFSVVTYTSLGYGDIRPTGFIRTICGFEALIGILMMAWSAAYTVSRLQNMWQGKD
jgi:hypothetical protein